MARIATFCAAAALFVALLAVGATAAPKFPQSKIEHVVVVMLENRAFDHMLGWVNSWLGPNKIDGLTGNESNTYNGTTFYVHDQSPYVAPFDPLHGVKEVTVELMNGTQWIDPAPMSGFCTEHAESGIPDYWMVMNGFAPNLVPTVSTLAQEFAVFDRWYSSLPGPTYPNRMFFQSGTSHGMTDNNIIAFLPGQPQTTMYDIFNAHNISWRNYYSDISDLILFKNMRTLENLERLRPFEEFANDTAAGNLPAYTWINPRFFPWFSDGAQDQHPDHDVVLGEKFVAEVYAALRASPLWERTALIVTYDEHGGFYDHVSPPAQGVPNPDGLISDDGFNFTRLGVRVPTLIASPWVPRGTVVHEPETAPRNRFEHSSMWATLRNLFGLSEQLTNRTEFAAPFDFVFSESAPRTDCPTTLPVPNDSPARQAAIVADQRQRQPNGLQRELFATLEGALGLSITEGAGFATQHDMSLAVRAMMEKLTGTKRA